MLVLTLGGNLGSGDARGRQPIQTVVRANVGSGALLPCSGQYNFSDLSWTHVGTSRKPNKMLLNGSLLVENVSEADSGNYTCMVEGKDGSSSSDEYLAVVHLIVLCQ
jgi:hypothetical protein